MMSMGFIDEVRGLTAKGYSTQLNALNTVGYKEAFEYLKEDLTEVEMVERIKRNTRHFAKRQLTWFKADKRIHWISISDETEFPTIARSIADQFQKAAARVKQV